MSRYRPPRPPSKPYITQSGLAVLQDELSALWRQRVDVTAALSAAAAEGDRSENAEYIYRKKQLAGIDRRIRYLQKRIPNLNVVAAPGDPGRVFFGARVELEAEDGKILSYRIVGADEISSDSSLGYISVDSPMAKALLGKQIDDDVDVIVAGERRSYSVLDISYDEFSPS